MTEKKLKPATKKVTPSKTQTKAKKSSVASSKPKTTKADAVTTAKKTAIKKPAAKKAAEKKPATAAAKPNKAKISAVVKAASKAVVKKAPAEKTAKPAKPAPGEKTVTLPTPEERYRMVETAAYFIAEQHGFQGRSDEHWAAAEREIAAKLGC